MRKNSGRMFIQNDAVYVAVVFVSVILFIGLIALQIFSGIHATRIFVGVALMFLSFAMNVFEGKFGFYIAYTLNFVQFMIYTYEYVMMQNESAPILLAMTFVTMVINMILQYYVIKLAAKIKGIEDAKRDERGKAIRKELEDQMFSRTSLIVNYEAMDSNQGLREAIGRKLNSSIDPLTTLTGAADPTDMVARIDDADFVILFRRSLTPEAEKKYADKLVKEAGRAFAAGIDSMNASIFYGTSHYPSDSRHGGELIAIAEERMSKAAAVAAGAPEDDTDTEPLPGEEIFKGKSKDEIIAVFERAITDGSLHMAYQPCFTADRKLTGFEAFLRFEKNGVSIPPQVFLAASENAGYMRRVGSFSLENSLGTLAYINKIDPNLTMNINISNYQLREPDFIQGFQNIVSSTDCNVKNLILDLQEESLISSLADIRMTIEELATTGVKMALDNFGRGYSSFNAIPLLPVSVLKLDGNFTSDLATDPTVRILTRSAITLMHDIDITVTATGVGQEDQFEILAGSGCDRFQGLFLGQAISPDEIEEFISVHSK